MKQNVTITIDKEIYYRFKIYCIENRKFISSMVEDFMTEKLQSGEKHAASKGVKLRPEQEAKILKTLLGKISNRN